MTSSSAGSSTVEARRKGGGAGRAAAAAAAAAPPPAMASKVEWVEIIEPRTKEHMFANLTTGECVWDPPVGVPVKKTSDRQWWELFDQNTSRFYYYNAANQKTVWHRPTDCDIIPLAKLQTLKQNTEVKDAAAAKDEATESQKTQTAEVLLDRMPKRIDGASSSSSSIRVTKTSLDQTSPVDSPKANRRSLRHRHHHHHHHHHHHSQRHLRDEDLQQQHYATATSPVKHQRFLHMEQPGRSDDKRRTTIGPAQAKYYSVPNRGDSAKLRLQQQQQQQQQQAQPQSPVYSVSSKQLPNGSREGSSSISRSVSFMSRGRNQQSSNEQQQQQHYWRSFENSSTGGRRSVESTPQSGRRVLNHNKTSPTTDGSNGSNGSRSTQERVVSPIEGYCTPMINRKSRSNSNSSQQQLMSITDLVDSGLSTLADGKPNNSQPRPRREQQPFRPQPKPRRLIGNNGTLERGQHSKMSPLQQYILEQAKMSGYRFGDGVTGSDDRDSYVEESEDDFRDGESDDFADDEDDLAGSDSVSKASSISGNGDNEAGVVRGGYLTNAEPTYNNLDPSWLRSIHTSGHGAEPPPLPVEPPPPLPRTSPGQVSTPDIDAFSEEFDLRMRMSHNNRPGGNNSSTMPRPASHQPSSSSIQQQHQQHHHHSHHMQNPSFPVPYEVLHPSLQRNAHSVVDAPGGGTLRSSSNHHHHQRNRSELGSSLSVSASLHSAAGGDSDIERYAQDNLNVQKKGLFRKKMTVKDILTHTKEPIRKPLTCVRDKAAKKESIEVFKLVQIYMGDRRARQGMTINSVALEITNKGYSMSALRDELYVQLCKQTTENANSRESLRRGWELMAICLSFFPPSPAFVPALSAYIQRHRDPTLDYYPDVGKWPIHVQISHYAGICAKRLARIGFEGGRLAPKRPGVEDIDQSRLQIFRPSMFGGTLDEAMAIQRDRFPQRRLPWILTTLAEQVLLLAGPKTEGIFRVPADLDEVNSLKSRFDQWEIPACGDCHTAASLLKLWLRELYEPLIPDELYEECVSTAAGSENSRSEAAADAVMTIVDRLPDVNRDVLKFLARFLQLFARPECVSATKMDAANLGTVFAPNCLRCPSRDPAVILENTRKEMAFVKNLIFHLDTSDMEGVL